MDRPQRKKCFDCGHRGHCRLYKVVLQNFCAVDRSTQWGRNICFYTFGGRSQNVCDQAVKNGRVRFVLIWCMVLSGLYCKTEENMVRGKPKNPLLEISEILPMCKWWLCSEMSSMQRRRNLWEKNEINWKWSKLTLNPQLTLTSTSKWFGEPDYQN